MGRKFCGGRLITMDGCLELQTKSICDRTTGLDIKSEKSILVLLHILIVDIMKSVFQKFDHSRTKIGFLTNF